MKKNPITINGLRLLKEELHRLKSVERPSIIQAISEARSHGDISENSEYVAAKEIQGFIEGRIADIESKLSNAQVIDPATLQANGQIVFGSTVELLEVESNQEVCYQIVGDDEADVKAGKISINSPLARALIGMEEGDTTTVVAPNGNKEYEILRVRYV